MKRIRIEKKLKGVLLFGRVWTLQSELNTELVSDAYWVALKKKDPTDLSDLGDARVLMFDLTIKVLSRYPRKQRRDLLVTGNAGISIRRWVGI